MNTKAYAPRGLLLVTALIAALLAAAPAGAGPWSQGAGVFVSLDMADGVSSSPNGRDPQRLARLRGRDGDRNILQWTRLVHQDRAPIRTCFRAWRRRRWCRSLSSK